MRGMGQVVTWSVRDESLHTEGVIRLFHEYAKETGAYNNSLKDDIREIAKQVVKLEDKFIELAFELGDQQELSALEV